MDSKVPVQMNSDQQIGMMEDVVERMVAAVRDGDYVTPMKLCWWCNKADTGTEHPPQG
jgi:hypothetical protein